MEVRFVQFDESHYASNATRADMILKWNAQGNTHTLIIRREFGCGCELSESVMTAIKNMAPARLLGGKEEYLTEGVYCCLVPKGYVNNYQITVCPASYSVFGCEYDAKAETLTVFLPNDACNYYCNVSLKVEISIRPEPEKRGFFKRKPDRKYFILHIPGIPGYESGSLFYTYEGCKYNYPITKEMLGKEISVPAFQEKQPQVKSTKSNGYTITIR